MGSGKGNVDHLPIVPIGLRGEITFKHRWALSPITVISYIGLSQISELPISDGESGVLHFIDIGIKFYSISDIPFKQTVTVT